MFAIFTTVLEMSMTASVVVVAVLAARVVLKRMPKIFSYILWALVLFRLLCLVSISSDLSVFQILHIPERVVSEANREIERKTYYVTMKETVVKTDVVSVDASKQPAAAEVDTAAVDMEMSCDEAVILYYAI